VEIQKPEACI